MKKKGQQPTPPRWASRLLQWFCAYHLSEEIQGDLEEEFYYQVSKIGLKKARLDYIRNVLGFIRPFAIKRKKSTATNSPVIMNMIGHYMLVALRNAVRQKAFSIINITGLVLGMMCCLFIFLWVQDEKSIDNFHANGKDLFVIYQSVGERGQMNGSYSTPFQLLYQDLNQERAATTALGAEDLRQAVPELKRMSNYATGYELPWGHPETLQVGDRLHKFNGSRASRDFFNVFSYPLLAGTAEAALHDISSIAISRKVAEIFFKDPQDAIGKSIRYENRYDYVVNAVFENVTSQSSLQFDFLLSWDSQLKQLDLSSPVMLTVLQLDEHANVNEAEKRLNQFLQSRLDQATDPVTTVGLHPYHDMYLYSSFVNGKPQEGRMKYVRIFTGVAVFILIIACINFMNLATARATRRAKEIGVRKVIGSSRAGLIGQFFGESVMLSCIAMIVSVLLLLLLLPSFNSLTGKQISSPVSDLRFWGSLIALMFVTGLIAGSYPALYLSSLRPVRILKGMLRVTGGSIWLRKGLVSFQFALSIALLIATIVVTSQTRYVQTKNLGYDRDNLIYIQIEGELNPKYALFKERALKMPGVAMVDRSTEVPHAMAFIVDNDNGFKETRTGDDAINWEGKEKNASVGFKPASVGFDFIRIMDLKVAEGRSFSKEYASDSADAFMVNEEAVRQMGLKDPIGRWVSAWKKKGHIIGILKDYHINSFHEAIKPLIIDVKEYEYFGVIMVRLEKGKTREGLASMEQVCKEINPNYPFVYQFADQEYARLYRSELVVTRLTNIFAILGIAISCLGLLGLVTLAADQRTKEIGIRKVLGATVTNIVNLLGKEFLGLVLIAFLIAAPVTGYLMYQWLADFAYRIELSWWIFALAGMMAVFIALLTISVQAIQSALVNPVKSLRAE